MKVVIIGNGISGVTAARWIRKLSDFSIQIISSETEHFYSRTALMYVYMGHMSFEDIKPYEDWFWNKNRLDLAKCHIDHIDFDKKILHTSDDKTISYDKLILALGSKSNKFGWPGQDLNGVSGLYTVQDLNKMEVFSQNLKRAVIVGGGLIGIEMAEMFHSRGIPVSMIVRERNYWDNVLPEEEAKMISDHIIENKIDLKLNSNLQEILDDGTGKVGGIIVKETGEQIDCGFVGLTPGVSPNVDFLKGTGLNIGRGIIVNEQLQTNIPDVFAIGDCAELKNPNGDRKSIEAVWYTGRIMGETVAHNICGRPIKYDPGIWFNSAKFIDLEYQVYGTVVNNPPENHKSLFWRDKNGKHCVRIVYDRNDLSILGFNLMGIRFRHEVCEKWIAEKVSVEQVLTNLGLANFDPEFYDQYEHHLVRMYNLQNNKNIMLSRKRGLNEVLKFLKNA